MSSSEVVQGFLDASASFDGDHAVARQYLTPTASADWDTNAGVTVYDGVPALSELGSAVVMAVREAGTIATNGRYEVTGPAAELRTTFDLTKVDGEWRIEDLPQGLLLSQSDVDRAFRSFSVYFFNPPFETLVPDPRMVPVIGPGLATTLVRRLVAGPSDWLQPAVRTGFPAGVRLNIDSVPDRGGRRARGPDGERARGRRPDAAGAVAADRVDAAAAAGRAGRGDHGGRPAAARARSAVAAATRRVAGRRSQRAADRLGRVRGSTRGRGPPHPRRRPAGPGRGRHRRHHARRHRGRRTTRSRSPGIDPDGGVWECRMLEGAPRSASASPARPTGLAFDGSSSVWVVDADAGLVSVSGDGTSEPITVSGPEPSARR